MTMVSLWLLLKVFCIVIAIPQNLGDFQVNTASQSPPSSKLHLQDDQVSQSQWGDSGRVSETFESFQKEMEARLRAQEAKSARQERLFATVLENFGHRMKESEETFERFRKEMEEKFFELERKSHAQELKTFNLIGEIGDRDRMFERFRQEMQVRLGEQEAKSAKQEELIVTLGGTIVDLEETNQEMSNAITTGAETEETLLLVTGGGGLYESRRHKILSEPEIYPANNDTECSLPSFPAG